MPEPYQFTDATARFGLPFLFAAQAQREFFVNEAFARADLLLHADIEGELTAPPDSPTDGHAWIIGSPATGQWESREGQIAGWQAAAWHFFEPINGMRVWDKAAGQFATFSGSWLRPTAPTLANGGTIIDLELRDAFNALLEALAKAGIFPVT